MRFFVIATRNLEASPSELSEKLLEAEGTQALKLMAEDFIREIYNRIDGTGGVVVVEAASEDEVAERLGRHVFVAV